MRVAASPSGPPSSRAIDEEHIVETLIAVATAFATCDADAARTAYALDADCIDASGKELHGRDVIVEHLRRRFAIPRLGPGSLVAPPTLALRWLGDDVVMATTYLERHREQTSDGDPLPPRRTHSLKVLIRGDDGSWVIVSDIYADAHPS
jgi:ketosteroid isomerase-like protein